MSSFDVQEFYQRMHEQQSANHKIHKTTIGGLPSSLPSSSLPSSSPSSLPPSSLPPPHPTKETFPANVAILDFYVRPQEIQSCTWSVDKHGNHPTPRDCACTDIPNSKACIAGYEVVKGKVSDTTLENNPDSAIKWCVQNVPAMYNNDVTSQHSWTIGCLDGIRGVHKVL